MDLKEIWWSVWTGFNWLRTEISSRLCEYSNKGSVTIKRKEIS
jgi:hypothetical protein